MDTTSLINSIAQRLSTQESRQRIIGDLLHIGYTRQEIADALNMLYASGGVDEVAKQEVDAILHLDTALVGDICPPHGVAKIFAWFSVHAKRIALVAGIFFIIVVGGGVGYWFYSISAPKVMQDAFMQLRAVHSFSYSMTASLPDAPVPLSIASEGIFDATHATTPVLSMTLHASTTGVGAHDVFAITTVFAGRDQMVYLRIQKPSVPIMEGQLLAIPVGDFSGHTFDQLGISSFFSRMPFLYNFSQSFVTTLKQIFVPSSIQSIMSFPMVTFGGRQAYHIQVVPYPIAGQSLITAYIGTVDSDTMHALLQGTWDVYIDAATRYPVALMITPSATTPNALAQGKISFSFGNYNTITAPPLDASSVGIDTVLGWMQETASSTMTLGASTTPLLHQ